jgi:membrane protein DedA with SNARE-associated domain
MRGPVVLLGSDGIPLGRDSGEVHNDRVVASRLPLDLPALVVVLGQLHGHLHGAPVDFIGVAVAAALSWIGVPGPGEPVLIAGGIWAAKGRLDLAQLLVIAWAAATAGGIAGWLLGRIGGRALWSAPGPLHRLRLRSLARGERFFARYGLLAIYLAPSWVAGIHGVSASRYLPANAISAVAWTLLVGLGAYAIGPSIEDVISDIGLAGSALLVVLVLLFAGGELLRRRRRRAGAAVQRDRDLG